MKPQIIVDGVAVTVWRYVARQRATGYRTRLHYSQPGMMGRTFIPRRLGPAGVSLEVTSEQTGWELWTESEKLEVWPTEPLALEDIAAIDTIAKTVRTRAAAAVAAEVSRKLLSETEYQMVQQERLIESNHAAAGALSGPNKQTDEKPQKPLSPPELDETLLWHFQQKIIDELDPGLKSAPSASAVFTFYCRDRMTLMAMARKHRWSYRTLKLRKAALEELLAKHFNGLTLEMFFVNRSIFSAAERQLADHRARHISRRALADADPEADES